MEGVGARLGRSSTRYGGPTTVFTGPVRKWKKKWVHVSPSNAAASSNHRNHVRNGNSNGNGGSHLLFYKWTPISQSQNNSNGNGNGDIKDDDAATPETEEPPRRKLKYIPVAVLEEQKADDAEPSDDEVKQSEADADTVEPTSKSDEKPDINDVPMEENQDTEDTPQPRQDLNESLDLNLGLKGSNAKADQTKNGQLDRVNSSYRWNMTDDVFFKQFFLTQIQHKKTRGRRQVFLFA